MGNLSGYNADEHEPLRDFTVLPEGSYEAIITESGFEDFETEKGQGRLLKLTLQIIAGEHKERNLWDRLCMEHSNSATAVTIANSKLGDICRAVGIMMPDDSVELHNKPLTIKIKQEEYNGKMQHKVMGYNAAVSTVNSAANAEPAKSILNNGKQPNGAKKRPWGVNA